VLVTRSQQGVAPVEIGQLFAQSLSAVHEATHFLSSGGGGGAGVEVVAGGTVDAGGAVWFSCCFSSVGTSAEDAQAAATRIAVIAKADLEKVVYFTWVQAL